jgi:hypothetical protein
MRPPILSATYQIPISFLLAVADSLREISKNLSWRLCDLAVKVEEKHADDDLGCGYETQPHER